MKPFVPNLLKLLLPSLPTLIIVFFMTAQPFEEEVSKDIEAGKLILRKISKVRARYLNEVPRLGSR